MQSFKKRKTKIKLISILLAIFMVFSLLPPGIAFAGPANGEYYGAPTQYEAYTYEATEQEYVIDDYALDKEGYVYYEDDKYKYGKELEYKGIVALGGGTFDAIFRVDHPGAYLYVDSIDETPAYLVQDVPENTTLAELIAGEGITVTDPPGYGFLHWVKNTEPPLWLFPNAVAMPTPVDESDAIRVAVIGAGISQVTIQNVRWIAGNHPQTNINQLSPTHWTATQGQTINIEVRETTPGEFGVYFWGNFNQAGNEFEVTLTRDGVQTTIPMRLNVGANPDIPAPPPPPMYWPLDKPIPVHPDGGTWYFTAVFSPLPPLVPVTFDWDYAGLYVEVSVPFNTPSAAGYAPAPAPARVGYTHTGWTPVWSVVTGARTYTATWEIANPVVVTFDWDYAGLYVEVNVPFNTPSAAGYAPAPAPARVGYTHTGWTPVWSVVTGARTYTAVWAGDGTHSYEVAFDFNFTEAPANVVVDVLVNDTAAAQAPTPPTRMGYSFTGWDPTPFRAVTGPGLVYVAQWTSVAVHEVTFERGYASENADLTVQVAHNATAEAQAPTDWTRIGYIFEGWEPDEFTPVTGPGRVYVAQWSDRTYFAVTFDWDWRLAGVAPDNIVEQVPANQLARYFAPAEEDIPEKVGYSFLHWQPEWTPVTYNGRIYSAVWEPITQPDNITVTFRGNGGTPDTQTREIPSGVSGAVYNTKLAEIETPTRQGFNFLGWSRTPGGPVITDAEWRTMVITEPTTFYAVWQTIGGGGGPGGGGGTPPGDNGVTPPPTDDPVQEPVTPRFVVSFTGDHIAYLVGFPDGTIRPNSTITRAEAGTIFFRLLEDNFRTQVWSQSNTFRDVVLINWFNNAVSTLANANIVEGFPDGTFRPNQAITRAEFATMIARFVEDPGYEGTGRFNDINGHWAEGYINIVRYFDWIEGFGDGNFRPNQNITRAEAAAIINRMLERLPENADDLLPGMVTWPDNMNRNAWFYLYIQEATNSHDFEMKENGVNERWTELREPRDWTVLERPNSRPGDIL